MKLSSGYLIPWLKKAGNRIRSAIKQTDFDYPLKHYTINLAPANIKKQGPLLDLAIAVGILQSTKQLPIDSETLFVGELSLSGALTRLDGILSIIHENPHFKDCRIIIPKANMYEWSLSKNKNVIPIAHLKDLPMLYDKKIVNHMSKTHTFKEIQKKTVTFMSLVKVPPNVS